MPDRLVVATFNRKKRTELERLLQGIPWTLCSLADFPELPPSPEDGRTFADNASQKALHYSAATGAWCLADDSGLEVDALDGRPGVHSARYAGEHASDEDNIRQLLRELADVPDSRRAARFRCALALVRPGTVVFQAEGVTEGRILETPSGSRGFGYDPVFFSSDLGLAFGEASAEEKDRVSHRGRALRLFLEHLRLKDIRP